MIKRLIFDVDDTLIAWKEEYWNTLKEVFEKLNIEYSEELQNKIIMAVDTYEDKYDYYEKQKMLEHINAVANIKFDMNFLNTVLESFGNCVPKKNEKLVDVLEYLSRKYNLVILTNWFEDAQGLRLESFGIKKFFKKIFASENFKVKPNKESFITAMENDALEECIMIGDSFKKDIQGAINVGMKAIYINPNEREEEKKDYTIINDITELKNIL